MYSNDLTPSDAGRAYQFAKNRQKQKPDGHNDTRLLHIDEELSYWKQRLLSAPRETRKSFIDRLIKLRAEQTVIHLAKLHDQKSATENIKTKKIIGAYYRDCFQLLRAAQ